MECVSLPNTILIFSDPNHEAKVKLTLGKGFQKLFTSILNYYTSQESNAREAKAVKNEETVEYKSVRRKQKACATAKFSPNLQARVKFTLGKGFQKLFNDILTCYASQDSDVGLLW
jgi:hypothetical protein